MKSMLQRVIRWQQRGITRNNNSAKVYVCWFCGKEFEDPSAFLVHINECSKSVSACPCSEKAG